MDDQEEAGGRVKELEERVGQLESELESSQEETERVRAHLEVVVKLGDEAEQLRVQLAGRGLSPASWLCVLSMRAGLSADSGIFQPLPATGPRPALFITTKEDETMTGNEAIAAILRETRENRALLDKIAAHLFGAGGPAVAGSAP